MSRYLRRGKQSALLHDNDCNSDLCASQGKNGKPRMTDIYVGPMIHLIKITFRVVFELPTASRMKYTPGGWCVTPQVTVPDVSAECNSSQKSWTKVGQKMVRNWTKDGQKMDRIQA